eukprot:scaffold25389_cov71-Cyclotella_meneghiniana.AAC.7
MSHWSQYYGGNERSEKQELAELIVPPRPQRTSLLWGFWVRVCSEGGRSGAFCGDGMIRWEF